MIPLRIILPSQWSPLETQLGLYFRYGAPLGSMYVYEERTSTLYFPVGTSCNAVVECGERLLAHCCVRTCGALAAVAVNRGEGPNLARSRRP